MSQSGRKLNFGITMFPTDYAIQPVELARAIESRGLDSVFFPEHTHIPACRTTPFPAGTELPKEYSHTHDPFVALAACAAVTERIKLGTGICLVIERDPIVLAKEIASLDLISNGRVILGIGAGWNVEEMENHGADYKNRWKIVREKILAMKQIWTEDEAEFHGEYVNFDPIWSHPKPVQPGGPPIWIGASSRWTHDRVAEYADGWLPIGGMPKGSLDLLAEACEKRDRKVEDITLALFGAPGDVESLQSKVEQGFTEFAFFVPPESADIVLPMLDNYCELLVKAGYR